MTKTTSETILHINAILARYRVVQREMATEIGIHEGTLSRILGGFQEPLPIIARALDQWLSDHSADYPVDLTKEGQK
jgi:transcriptional regulator with XRE-family HTH domain